MTQKDPYEILGVSRSASQDEIKRNYRRLAKKHHPDRNPNDKSATERFKEVQAAYEVLGDPERRAQFDQFGVGGPAPNFNTWGAGGASPFEGANVDFGDDLSSIFEQFFRRSSSRATGRRRTRQPKPKGADFELDLVLGFMEAVNGAARDVVITDPDGKTKRQTISVRIPAGVTDGQRIRVRGKGGAGPGGAGDILIRCRITTHPYFKRDGADVSIEVPLTIAEASLGAKVEVPTLDGGSVVTIPPGTSSGARLRLRGKGVKSAQGSAGDLYVVTRVAVPKDPSPRAKELIEELARELNQRPRDGLGWPK